MPRFASVRERRLWIWTALIVAGIFSTLGTASRLAAWFSNQPLIAILFVTGMLLVLLTILTHGLAIRPHGIELGVWLGIGAVYFMVLLRCTIPERSHLIEYGVLAVFIYEALAERSNRGRRVRFVAVMAIGSAGSIGIIDELVQMYVPDRVFEWEDVAFNVLASSMSVVAVAILRGVRRFILARRGAMVIRDEKRSFP